MPQTINLADAKTNLSQLVDRAAAGEEIIIAKYGHPMARLAPLTTHTTPRTPGQLKGQITIGKDFDAPLPAEPTAALQGAVA